jgi:hypothetical protein
LAYNNDVYRFKSNSPLAPKYCDVQLGGNEASNIPNVNIRLYSDPDNNFFLNLKPYITALINSTNFQDTLNPNIDASNPATFLYDQTVKNYIQKGTLFTITLADDTVDSSYKILDYIAGVVQLGNSPDFNKNSLYALSAFKPGTTNTYYLKYWQGYPFDVSLHYIYTNKLKIKNLTTLFEEQFISQTGHIQRLFFSDGRTDETLEDLLPMQEGFNQLQLTQSPILVNSTPVFESAADRRNNTIYITLEKVPYTCGVYLKWFNAMGGYSYWLFEDTYSIDRSTKQLGELDYDNTNVENTNTRTLQIGKESQDTLKIIAELLTPDERSIVEGLLDSPKIYLFTGKPFSRNSSRDWVEVTLKTTSARIKNPRQQLTNFSFDLELPVRYSQTL